jgi:hypothetical protein
LGKKTLLYTNIIYKFNLKTKNAIFLIIGTCSISAIDIMRILLNDGDGHSAETVTSVVATNGTTSGDVVTSHDFTGMTNEGRIIQIH